MTEESQKVGRRKNVIFKENDVREFHVAKAVDERPLEMYRYILQWVNEAW